MSYVKQNLRLDIAPNHESLVSAIVSELKNEKGLSQRALKHGTAPNIVEQQMRNSDRLQVYVKWPTWEGVRENHRSTAILDAYERAFGKEYAGRVVIALGLTPEEATALGIQF